MLYADKYAQADCPRADNPNVKVTKWIKIAGADRTAKLLKFADTPSPIQPIFPVPWLQERITIGKLPYKLE